MILNLIEEAQRLFLNQNEIEREVGFHASQGGMCIKKVIIETMFPEAKTPFDTNTQLIFRIGNDYHDKLDEMLRLLSRETGKFLWIQPWRMTTYGRVMKKAFSEANDNDESIESPVPLHVFGTADFIGIEPRKKKLLFADFKTANSRSFAMKKKGNRSNNYAVQVGSYLPGVYEMFSSLGMVKDFEEVSILYVNKDDMALCSHNYNEDHLIPIANAYWTQVAIEFAAFIASGGTILPEAAPPEKWMCNYCNVFKNNTECIACGDSETLMRLVESRKVVQNDLL